MINALSQTVAAVLSALTFGQVAPITAEDQGPPGRDDVVCLAVAIHLGQAGDQNAKEAAGFLGIYYFGRAQAQLSEAALMEELRAVVPRIAGDRWEVEKSRCAEGLGQAGELLTRSVDAVSAQLAN